MIYKNTNAYIQSTNSLLCPILGMIFQKVEHYNKIGYPSETIVETATETGCDCIDIGSRGLSGIKEAVLGSVSSQVAHLAKQPVLIVK